jgi:hypothetical protein
VRSVHTGVLPWWKLARHTACKKTASSGQPDQAIVCVSALLKLAHWCQQRYHSCSGGLPCTQSRTTVSPPALPREEPATPPAGTLAGTTGPETRESTDHVEPPDGSTTADAGRSAGGVR